MSQGREGKEERESRLAGARVGRWLDCCPYGCQMGVAGGGGGGVACTIFIYQCDPY